MPWLPHDRPVPVAVPAGAVPPRQKRGDSSTMIDLCGHHSHDGHKDDGESYNTGIFAVMISKPAAICMMERGFFDVVPLYWLLSTGAFFAIPPEVVADRYRCP